MNWAQFKYPVSHMCLAGAVVASWFLTQEVAGLNPFTVMTNIFVNSVKTFRKNSIKTAVCVCVSRNAMQTFACNFEISTTDKETPILCS